MLKSGNPLHLSRLRRSIDRGDLSPPQQNSPQPQPPSQKRSKVTPLRSLSSSVSLPQISTSKPQLSRSDRPLPTPKPLPSKPQSESQWSHFPDPRFRPLTSPQSPVTRAPLPPSETPPRTRAEPVKPSKPRKQPPPKSKPPSAKRKADSAFSPRPKMPPKPQSPVKPFLYGVRMLIWGVGLSAIAGTMLSLWNPAKLQISESPASSSPEPTTAPVGLPLARELDALKASVEQVAQQNPGLNPGVFLLDLDTGNYLNLNGSEPFSSASTIKVPILVAFFQAVDAGQIRLDEPLTIQPHHLVGGSGYMQDDPPGTTYTALEVATATIVTSDNTATNVLIERLGGAEVLNQSFESWGLTETALRNPLPDLEGTNTTTPKDLADLMSSIEQGELISLRSRDRILDIMQATENDTLLPQGLGTGASIAHKTGNIKSVLADAGLIDLPSGKRYIAVVMVERPDDDDRAADTIRKISSIAYEHFDRLDVSHTATTHPALSSTTEPTPQVWKSQTP